MKKQKLLRIPRGYSILNDGDIISVGDKFVGYGNNWVEITKEDAAFALRKFTYNAYIGKVYSREGFGLVIRKEVINLIQYSKDQKIAILDKLKSARANNADSGIKFTPEDKPLLLTLAKKRIIGRHNDKFFLLKKMTKPKNLIIENESGN